MNEVALALGWIGIYSPMAIGAIGSSIGCGIAGQAGIGAMLETEGGYGRYIGLSAFPSSFVIYGIVIMFTLNREVTAENAGALFGIGLFSGLALLFAGIWQGRACASAINASKEKPEIFGRTLIYLGLAEGIAIYGLVMSILLLDKL